jgi:hypothetical protein
MMVKQNDGMNLEKLEVRNAEAFQGVFDRDEQSIRPKLDTPAV